MRVPRVRVRLTIGRLMLAICVVGVASASARVHLILGASVVAVAGLALCRAFAEIDRRRAKGIRLSGGQEIRLLIGSLGIMLTVFGASCSGLLCGCIVVGMLASTLTYDSALSLQINLAVGSIAAVGTFVLISYHLWPYLPSE